MTVAPFAQTRTYDHHSFQFDGAPVVIRSGAMHYFRLPGPDLWWDRLSKLKASGYNTVDLYFCWSYHSSAPGEYDFTGIRDVNRLLDMVEELGLYLIARPGPYINAEYTAGGLPGWLLVKDGVILRNRHPGGAYEWSDAYMEAVSEWWKQIVPFFANRPNLLMVQIENEYATLDMEPDYMEALATMTRELGVTAPLMHNDMYAAGLYEDIVDIYAFDNYSVTSFEMDWRERAQNVFSILDHVEENLRPFCEERPLMVAELQAGWFGTWKGYKYEEIIHAIGREHISIATKTLLAQGLTIFNHYKAVGGTNWDTIGSTDTYTSYDFAAPISETGLHTERLYDAKNLNYLLESFPCAVTDPVEGCPAELSDTKLFYKARQIKGTEAYWLFFRNLHQSPGNFTLNHEAKINLQPFEMVMLPYNMSLKSGFTLHYSTVEPLYQNEHVLFFKGGREATVSLKLPTHISTDSIAPQVTEGELQIAVDGHSNTLLIQCPPLTECQKASMTVGQLTIHFLGHLCCETFWVRGNGSFILGPQESLPDGNYALEISSHSYISIAQDGTPSQPQKVTHGPSLQIPTLQDWELSDGAPAISNEKQLELMDFHAVSLRGLDLDHNRLYEGAAWYWVDTTGIRDCPKTLTIDGRHLWAVYLNGTPIGHGTHFSVHPGDIPPDPTTLEIPDTRWNTDGTNTLLIFVDGLGHPKGFHDDADWAQGLLELKLDDTSIHNRIQLCAHSPFSVSPQTLPQVGSPIIQARCQFHLPMDTTHYAPMGLVVDPALPVERLNIFLNGVQLGRYWQGCQRQTKFYLPPSVLNSGPDGTENHLLLEFITFEGTLKSEHLPLSNTAIYLEPYGQFTRFRPVL